MKIQEENQKKMILDLASKYRYNEKHARFVEETALKIFDSIKKYHKCGQSEKALLSSACLLHDIGSFIDEKKHNKHSKYIIDNDTALEDYPEKERDMLSLITYNHRRKIHKDTLSLPKEDRNIVLKLSAILRIADSLDSNNQKFAIKSIDAEDTGVNIIFDGKPTERVYERFNEKKGLFIDVFKQNVILSVQ